MCESNRTSSLRRILLAEDDGELRELLSFALQRAGFAVTSCSNGLELFEQLDALPATRAEAFDLVLTDLRMPALSGLEVLETLHDLPQRPPFICMTAFGDSATHARARSLGATLTIDKPFDLDRLISLIDSLCPLHEPHQTESRSAS